MSYLGNTPTQQGFIPAIDFFSGNGSTVAFTLSRPVASVAQVQATIENVPQNPGTAFTVSGNTITFDGAPASGTNNIYVYYTSPITQVIAPSQGTVGTAQIVDNAVTTAKIADSAITTAKIAAGAVIAADIASGQTFALNGVQFPTTQVPSGNANTLDDYEEGEVTLQLADAASGGNAYNMGTRYIKIGRMVFLNFSAYYTSSPSWTSGNDIFLRGLPFVTQFEGSAGAIMLRYGLSNGTAAYLWQPSGQTHFVLKQMNFDSPITGANMLSTFSMYGNVCYLTAN